MVAPHARPMRSAARPPALAVGRTESPTGCAPPPARAVLCACRCDVSLVVIGAGANAPSRGPARALPRSRRRGDRQVRKNPRCMPALSGMHARARCVPYRVSVKHRPRALTCRALPPSSRPPMMPRPPPAATARAMCDTDSCPAACLYFTSYEVSKGAAPCVCVCVCVCINAHTRPRAHTHTSTHLYVCLYIIYVCVCVCV